MSALYVFDPGPEGSLGDSSWIVEARSPRHACRCSIVQGVLLSDLARAADFVLPGASFVEKEASYTNDQGRLQGAARVIPAPGEAMEDWQILVTLAAAARRRRSTTRAPRRFAPTSPRDTRTGRNWPGCRRWRSRGVVTARHWLQASNPSERWKWDFMFQDLPPVKGSVDPSSLPPPPGVDSACGK